MRAWFDTRSQLCSPTCRVILVDKAVWSAGHACTQVDSPPVPHTWQYHQICDRFTMSGVGGGKVEEGGAEAAKTGAHTWGGDWEGIDPTQPCEAAKVRTLVPPAPSLTPWLTLSDHSVYPVFQSLARFQIVEKVPTEFPKTGTPDGHIRIVCISGAGATT